MEVTTDSAVKIYGEIKSDTGISSISLDVSPIAEKIHYQNDLLFFTDILLFAILIFMSFKQSFRGLWK